MSKRFDSRGIRLEVPLGVGFSSRDEGLIDRLQGAWGEAATFVIDQGEENGE